MALIISPLINAIWLVLRLAFFIWLLGFLRCFASISDQINSGALTLKPVTTLLLLSACMTAAFLVWKIGMSMLRGVSAWEHIGGLIAHELRQGAKIRAAKQSSIITFEDELAEAADDQLLTELFRVEAANWDFDAVMRMDDEAEARRFQRYKSRFHARHSRGL